jgi:hypothetical protein
MMRSSALPSISIWNEFSEVRSTGCSSISAIVIMYVLFY